MLTSQLESTLHFKWFNDKEYLRHMKMYPFPQMFDVFFCAGPPNDIMHKVGIRTMES